MVPIKPFLFIAGACSLLAIAGCGGGAPNPTPTGNNGPTVVSASLSGGDFYDSKTDRYYDIFVADALTTSKARVEMRSGDFDTQFYVYEKDTTGNYKLIESNDDATSDTTDSDDTFNITYGNTYRIVATSAQGDQGGTYQIRFSSELTKPAQVTTQDEGLAVSAKKLALPARLKK